MGRIRPCNYSCKRKLGLALSCRLIGRILWRVLAWKQKWQMIRAIRWFSELRILNTHEQKIPRGLQRAVLCYFFVSNLLKYSINTNKKQAAWGKSDNFNRKFEISSYDKWFTQNVDKESLWSQTPRILSSNLFSLSSFDAFLRVKMFVSIS